VRQYNSATNYLISEIEVEARLLKSIGAVEEKMSNYPNLAQVGRGTRLSYIIPGNKDCFYLLKLGKSSMALCIHSSQSPLYFMHEALLRLLSVMQMLSGEYEVSASKLLPYLIAVLARQQISHYSEMINGNNSELTRRQSDQTDITLARRISYLLKENSELSQSNVVLSSKVKALATKLILLEYGKNASVNFISKETGFEKSEVESMIAGMKEQGYKAVFKNPDRFELVRL
jgi:hypothetical protein